MEKNMSVYERLMDMLAGDLEKMHDAFIDAYGKATEAEKKMELCKEYAQTVSGLGLLLSTLNLMRPMESYHGMGVGLGCKEQ